MYTSPKYLLSDINKLQFLGKGLLLLTFDYINYSS